MFKVGNAIIYPHHGAGRITGEKTIARNGEENDYFVVDILLKQQTVMLPKQELEEVGVRKPTEKEEFFDRLQQIHDAILEDYDPVEGEHPEKIHQKTLESMLDDVRQADLDTMMEGLEKLHTRFLDQKLNVTEKRVYDTSQAFVVGEIMAILDCSEKEARAELNKYLPQELPEPPEEEEEES